MHRSQFDVSKGFQYVMVLYYALQAMAIRKDVQLTVIDASRVTFQRKKQ